MNAGTRTVHITIPDRDNELTVTGYYYPGYAGCMYKRNGDPGDPPEPATFEVDKVMDGDEDITPDLSDYELDAIQEAAIEEIGESDYDYDEDFDWRRGEC